MRGSFISCGHPSISMLYSRWYHNKSLIKKYQFHGKHLVMEIDASAGYVDVDIAVVYARLSCASVDM